MNVCKQLEKIAQFNFQMEYPLFGESQICDLSEILFEIPAENQDNCDKYRKHRLANNAAVKKSRQKKSQEYLKMKDKVCELEALVDRQKLTIEVQEKQINFLKSVLENKST